MIHQCCGEFRLLIEELPLYLDGSDGSMWPSRHPIDVWAEIIAGKTPAETKFVRVSDLLDFLEIPYTKQPTTKEETDAKEIPAGQPVS